jgi:bilirubin oxidase
VDAAPVGPEEAGRKDMVLLYPNEVIRIIVRFSDFADTTMPYMYHCHILTHEDEGMMGQFLVVPSTTKIRSEVSIEGSFYHNPFADKLMLPESALHQPIRIMNAMGQTIFEGIPERSELETTGWPGGIYCIVSNRGVDRVVKK